MRRIFSLLLLTGLALPAHANSDRKYDFRFNPLGFVFGSIEADLNIAIASNWTLGPQWGVVRHKYGADAGFTSDYDVKGYMLGLRGNWFMNGNFTDGLYIGPSLKWAEIKVATTDSIGPVTKSIDLTLISCLVGYGWFWDSFNIMAGGGLTVGLGPTSMQITNFGGTTATVASNTSGFAAELALGWTF